MVFCLSYLSKNHDFTGVGRKWVAYDISAALLLTEFYIARDYLCYSQVVKCIIVTEKECCDICLQYKLSTYEKEILFVSVI